MAFFCGRRDEDQHRKAGVRAKACSNRSTLAQSQLAGGGRKYAASCKTYQQLASDSTMFTGTIAKWISDRRYGFIQPSLGGRDVFFHQRSISGGIFLPEPGLKVLYEVETVDGRDRAARVELDR